MRDMGRLSPTINRYDFVSGSRHKVSAQVAGEVCRKLEETGGLTPERLVEASRPKDAPVHDEFEWDDAIAGERYRNVQAAELIRHIVLVPNDDAGEEPVNTPVVSRKLRAFSSTREGQNGKKGVYVSTPKMLGDAELKRILMGNAISELSWYRRKYAHLKGLSDAFDNVLHAIGQLSLKEVLKEME